MAKVERKPPRGIRNNNPLNIRKGSSWKGERPQQTDPAFEEFVSMEWGIRAALKLIRNHITGFGGTRPKMNNLCKLIGIWAPVMENDTVAYIATVCNRTGYSAFQILDSDNETMICKIAQSMAFVECGVELDEELFHSAWSLL